MRLQTSSVMDFGGQCSLCMLSCTCSFWAPGHTDSLSRVFLHHLSVMWQTPTFIYHATEASISVPLSSTLTHGWSHSTLSLELSFCFSTPVIYCPHSSTMRSSRVRTTPNLRIPIIHLERSLASLEGEKSYHQLTWMYHSFFVNSEVWQELRTSLILCFLFH